VAHPEERWGDSSILRRELGDQVSWSSERKEAQGKYKRHHPVGPCNPSYSVGRRDL